MRTQKGPYLDTLMLMLWEMSHNKLHVRGLFETAYILSFHFTLQALVKQMANTNTLTFIGPMCVEVPSRSKKALLIMLPAFGMG